MERRSSFTDGKLERAKDAALGPHDDQPSVGDLVGEAAGGISGVLAGAAIGSFGGPVGTVIGGIAGAIGGWWSGRAISEAVGKITEDDETHYRRHYERTATRAVERSYDEARPAYQLGHIAGMNPDYKGRRFEEIETDLQRGWSDDVRGRYGEWDAVRGYVEEAYNRRVETPDSVSARTGEPAPADEAPSERSKTSGTGADESSRGAADHVAPEGEPPADGSSATQHRSIPRGTDEGSRP
jgi:outer membrane lipoprotein SlyB